MHFSLLSNLVSQLLIFHRRKMASLKIHQKQQFQRRNVPLENIKVLISYKIFFVEHFNQFDKLQILKCSMKLQLQKKIMNNKIILVLVLALALANAGDLSFSLQGIQYNKAPDYWSVNVPCNGASAPQNLAYTCELPTGWRLENNIFKIPAAHASSYNSQYICRCRVRDNVANVQLERALSFKCTQTGFVVSDFDYFYGQSSYSTGATGSLTGLDIIQRLQSLSGSILSGVTGLNGGVSVLNNLGSLSGYTGTVSTGLPSWTDCDRLIKDGNIAEILALIQKVVSSTTIKCEAKTAFLNDLLGRICAAIEIKKESVFQIKALIDGVQSQILKLKAEAESLKNEQALLNIEGLKAQYQQLLVKVKAAYDLYNNCTASDDDEIKQLEQYKLQLKEIEAKIYQLQCDLGDCQAKLQKYDDNIAALEAQLVKLKNQRAQVKIQCDKISAEIKAAIDLKNTITAKIQWLITEIEKINQQCSGLKDAYLKLQYDLKCLNEQIAKAQARYHEIDQRITQINIEIERLRAQSAEYQLKWKALQQCIENLNSAIKEIKESIQYVHYHCNNCPNVVVDDTDVEPCFKFGRLDWFNYMSKCYGVPQTQIQVSFPQVTIEIKTITVFTPIFQQNYGSCFGDQIKTKGSQWNTQPSYGFDNDFQCSSGVDAAVAKKGKIRAITNKHVDVDCDDGQQVRLRLGSCSRFEGQGRDFVPKVGHSIAWKGAKNMDSTFNLHSCTCF